MGVVAVQIWEDNHRHIGWENIDGAPLGRTATAAPMAPTTSIVEEKTTKNRPSQSIRHKIAEVEMVS